MPKLDSLMASLIKKLQNCSKSKIAPLFGGSLVPKLGPLMASVIAKLQNCYKSKNSHSSPGTLGSTAGLSL